MVFSFSKIFLTVIICFIALFVSHTFVLASTTDGTVSGYAWSDKIGWVNFGTTNGNVRITDSAVTGYAWNENTGRILLSPTNSGVANNAEGTLSGRAFAEGTGWINFSGVTISSTGAFSGTATGDNSVNIYFSCSNCNVATDWRPQSNRCGDGRCLGTEGCTTCPSDCGVCNVGGGAEFVLRKYPQEPVKPPEIKIVNILEPIIQKIQEVLKPFIPKFLLPPEPLPKPVVTVPKKAQTAFLTKWRLLPEKPIARFVLAPLPQDIRLLAQKFPEVKKTFQEVGITKITDVQKIKNVSLNLPGLTETVRLAKTGVSAGKMALVRGIPIAQLSVTAKSKIPSDVVFLKAGGGIIDLNIALSVNSKGQIEQRIKTTVNSRLQLVVKPESNVKKVRGYIIFKSKKPSNSPSLKMPMNNLASSFIFSDLIVVMPAALSVSVPVEGSSLRGGQQSDAAISNNEIASSPEAPRNDGITNIEQRLVLAEFEYVDSGNGIYIADIQAPVVDGEYEIITVMEYEDEILYSREIKLITVVDPEGYIYEKDGNKETRILGAVVSIYWLNPDTKQYELWPAKNYQQENPQTTDVRGTYSFLVPDGFYYLKVDVPGYLSYDGKPFQVTEGSGIHINVELKTRFWFLNIVDWKTSLLIVVILLLLYNFYKDKRRERQTVIAN